MLRLISILIIFAILMQNVVATILPTGLWIETANALENSNDRNLEMMLNDVIFLTVSKEVGKNLRACWYKFDQ